MRGIQMSGEPTSNGDGWNQWSRYVLAQLREIDSSIKDLNSAVLKLTLSAAEQTHERERLGDVCLQVGKNKTKIEDLTTRAEHLAQKQKVLYYVGGLIVTILVAIVIKWITTGLGF